jgi:hypothetical protein
VGPLPQLTVRKNVLVPRFFCFFDFWTSPE